MILSNDVFKKCFLDKKISGKSSICDFLGINISFITILYYFSGANKTFMLLFGS